MESCCSLAAIKRPRPFSWGAASCDLPSIVVSGGPMLCGDFRGQRIGSGTDLWRFREEVKAGRMSAADMRAAEVGMNRSAGSCKHDGDRLDDGKPV